MTIEPYSDKYFLDVVRLAESFYTEAVKDYESHIDAHAVIDTIKAQADNGFVLVIDGKAQGVLSGHVMKSMLNDGLIFQETIWYVSPNFRKYGTRLLSEATKILKMRGVSMVIMVALANSMSERLGKFYKRLGFKEMETHYMSAI